MIGLLLLICCAISTANGQDLRARLDEGLRLQKEGLLEEAHREARAAVALARTLPSAGRNYLEAIILLAGILEDEGKFEEAEKWGRMALALAEEHPEWESGLITALSNLGRTLLWTGRPAEAKLALDRALALASAPGEPEYKALTPLYFLGLLYRLTGDPARALPLARRALFLLEQDGHPDLYLYLKLRSEIGEVLMSLRRFSSAADEFGRATSVMGAACVTIQPCQLTRIRLGAAMVNAGSRAEGLALIEEGVRYLESALGVTSAFLAAPLENLAIAYFLLRRLDDAERAARRPMAIMEQSGVNREPGYAKLLLDLAAIQREQGRKREAKAIEQQARRMLAGFNRTGGR
jgi:tetratricopeptide (TPR) repeat protein